MSINIHDKDKKVYIILGMSHSGTSFFSKALYDQGVNMGTAPSDFYENPSAVRLNKKIIKKDSLDPEMLNIDLTPQIKRLIKRYQREMWGFKDPRTSLTVDHYLPHLENHDVYLIAVFRKPERVKKSLERVARKHKIKVRDYDEMTNKYNRKIIESIKKFVGLE